MDLQPSIVTLRYSKSASIDNASASWFRCNNINAFVRNISCVSRLCMGFLASKSILSKVTYFSSRKRR